MIQKFYFFPPVGNPFARRYYFIKGVFYPKPFPEKVLIRKEVNTIERAK